MNRFLHSLLLVGILIFCIHISLAPGCHGGRPNHHQHWLPSNKPAFKLKAVSLGGWLNTEGWIKPSLFDGIPNKDLLDGTQVQLKSVTIGKYLYAKNGGGSSIIVADRTPASGWGTFKLWRINANTFNFRVFSNQFIGLQNYGDASSVVAVANAYDLGASETFKIVRKPDNTSLVRIQAPNGLFLQAKTEQLVTADYAGDGGWGDDNPSVFVMIVVATLQGEYQVTNGYGPEIAPKVMKNHWNTYIVEDDFKFISENGLNAVRIPVGWWIASDPTPKPFVEGSLQALDNAFYWAQKYKLQVMIDLHAAPGSQNVWEHSGTRDGSLEWGKTDETIQQTVAVIDFLTARYAKNPYLYAVELINEPHAPEVSLDTLKKYYQLGYDAVRKYSSSAYVVMSNRLGWLLDPRELFPLASGLQATVIDVHFYNVFSDIFENMTVEQNIDYININRTSHLSYLASTSPNDPLTFVGEWTAEWEVSGATKEEIQNFTKAQLRVYGEASFGWAFWTLKNVRNYWNMKWMIQNGYINLKSH